MSARRGLHFVFKVGNRTDTIKFYRDILGIKVLRHEEFVEGCKAACNGPYDGKWSKTMVGYGAEDNHFVFELTYNYGIKSYKRGNDFRGVTIWSDKAVEKIKSAGYKYTQASDGCLLVEAPGGFPFCIADKDNGDKDPVVKVTLSVSSLQKSLEYWNKLLGMKIMKQTDTSAELAYSDSQCRLELSQISEPVDHAEAFGRIAFSCPRVQLPEIVAKMKETNHVILTPLVSLDTPGKATVEVVILADPDGHEICFVGDEAFRELSQVDPKADQLIDEAMQADKSAEWFAKHGSSKGVQQ
ncbi:glyoxalase domain-containing protein 4-like isoform X1 [Dysidea avara]|uniref:glyoxalase domain-containing protein 4-like isoform X1 n=1 Tax=Dysidea avara TaxID=196820 RepID=UPI0033241962